MNRENRNQNVSCLRVLGDMLEKNSKLKGTCTTDLDNLDHLFLSPTPSFYLSRFHFDLSTDSPFASTLSKSSTAQSINIPLSPVCLHPSFPPICHSISHVPLLLLPSLSSPLLSSFLLTFPITQKEQMQFYCTFQYNVLAYISQIGLQESASLMVDPHVHLSMTSM